MHPPNGAPLNRSNSQHSLCQTPPTCSGDPQRLQPLGRPIETAGDLTTSCPRRGTVSSSAEDLSQGLWPSRRLWEQHQSPSTNNCGEWLAHHVVKSSSLSSSDMANTRDLMQAPKVCRLHCHCRAATSSISKCGVACSRGFEASPTHRQSHALCRSLTRGIRCKRT